MNKKAQGIGINPILKIALALAVFALMGWLIINWISDAGKDIDTLGKSTNVECATGVDTNGDNIIDQDKNGKTIDCKDYKPIV